MYPDAPRVGVGAVVFHSGSVLLVRRKDPPLAGSWSLPGGLVELGETLEAAVVREVQEETGVVVTVERLVDLFDHIERDAENRVRYHYVLADYLCRYVSGEIVAGSDAADVTWSLVDSLSDKELPPRALDLVYRAQCNTGA